MAGERLQYSGGGKEWEVKECSIVRGRKKWQVREYSIVRGVRNGKLESAVL